MIPLYPEAVDPPDSAVDINPERNLLLDYGLNHSGTGFRRKNTGEIILKLPLFRVFLQYIVKIEGVMDK